MESRVPDPLTSPSPLCSPPRPPRRLPLPQPVTWRGTSGSGLKARCHENPAASWWPALCFAALSWEPHQGIMEPEEQREGSRTPCPAPTRWHSPRGLCTEPSAFLSSLAGATTQPPLGLWSLPMPLPALPICCGRITPAPPKMSTPQSLEPVDILPHVAKGTLQVWLG